MERRMPVAPIALFVYNRLRHTKKTIEYLQKNEMARDSELYIFSDGAKNESAREGVEEVRAYIKEITGFKSISMIERKENLGLAKSIITGVTDIIGHYGRVIVLEDDLITSPYFLRFMNEALDYYEIDDRVISIHGYCFPMAGDLPETFFLRGADCWGWATWKRGWNLFETDGFKLLKEMKEKRLTRLFNVNGSYPFTRMLKDQVAGRNNSWAIRWQASAFLREKLTLYPGRSLVNNIGMDISGTHCKMDTDVYEAHLSSTPIKIKPIPVEVNNMVFKRLSGYFRRASIKLIASKGLMLLGARRRQGS